MNDVISLNTTLHLKVVNSRFRHSGKWMGTIFICLFISAGAIECSNISLPIVHYLSLELTSVLVLYVILSYLL